MPRIAVVGLGALGRPMARFALDDGWDVVGYDLDADAVAAFVALGGSAADDAGEAAKGADVVLVTVGPASAVDDVMLDPDHGVAAAGPGTRVAVASTMTPTSVRDIAERAAAFGVDVVDATIVGGAHGVEHREAVAYIGGSHDAVAAVTPIYELFCAHVVHVGDVGAGAAAKLANNLIMWSTLTATVEAVSLCAALGVDHERLTDALAVGPARTYILDTWDRPRQMPWCDEDMAMVLDEGAHVALEMPVARVVQEAVGDVRRRKDDAGLRESSIGAWVRSLLGSSTDD